MSIVYTQLNNETHSKLKIKPNAKFPHLNEQQLVPVIVHELSRLATEYPLVFVKNSETGEFQLVALLGLKQGQNLCLDGDKWNGLYIPEGISYFPLALTPSEESKDQMFVAIAAESDLVNEEEGLALFDDSGDESEFLKKQKNGLLRYYENSQVTRGFCQFLADNELLTLRNLSVKLNDKQADVNGVYLVDEKKLTELADDKFTDLRKRGFLPPIYSHLVSMHQLKRLAEKAM